MKKFNLPQTYKAIVYNLFGNPSEVLKVVRLEMPIPLDNELLVQMHACAINPSDLLTIRGRYPDRVDFPKIAGFEGVGTVRAAGDSNNNHLVGKRVLALKGKDTWREYNIIPVQEAILIPDEIDNRTAAQLYINPLTCWLMLVNKLKIDKSDILLINAGNSICGHIIAGFSKILSFDLISIVRSAENKVKLEQFGLKKVINSNEEDISEAILKFTNNRGVDYALDAIGGNAGAEMLKAINPGGKFLQYGLMSGQQLPASFFTDATEKNVQFEFYHLRDWVYGEPVNYRQEIFKQMIEHFIKADIKLPIDTEYNIDQIAKAVIMAESEGRNGKILLNFDLNTNGDTEKMHV
ncbi:zinc-dependent alcohol dehydrogenase family protein [Candidatus Tisiphia endosymbiont of Hybos culiciformis]|uniref:zinc-dependent alcohol dehydrogenase family protein n=1 Tax=Candidatus Tisiphia endosymbiont of Hybos culiciformis TaxID=3139331 RepID=UPI003CCACC77